MKIKFKFCRKRNYAVLGWQSAVRQHLTSEQVLTGSADWDLSDPEVDSVEKWLGCVLACETS
jgi:hypothetical protein